MCIICPNAKEPVLVLGAPKSVVGFALTAFLAAWLARQRLPGFPFGFPEGLDARFSSALTGIPSAMAFPRPALRFAWAGDFSQGLAPVEISGRYGWIDSAGALAVPARFEGAGGFSGGLAPFQSGGKWGYLDATGKAAIAPEYAWAGPFREGLAAVAGDSGFLFIDTAGIPIGTARFTDARSFSGGYAAVRFGQGENYAWGFIDRAGRLAIEPVFPEAPSGFSEGRARVRVEIERPWRCGFIDTSGGFAIDTLYDAAGDFAEGLAAVGRGEWEGLRFAGTWGYVDTSGAQAIGFRFAEAGPFRGGRALVRLASGAWAQIARDGRVVREFRADLEVQGGAGAGMVTYKLPGSGMRGLLDPETGAATAPTLAEAGALREGWARARMAGAGSDAWGFLGRDGAWLGGAAHAKAP